MHKAFRFTVSGCCDDKGGNNHAGLPFYCPSRSILDADLAGERVFMNPPWRQAAAFVKHLKTCYARDPDNTMAVIVLPDFPGFESITKGLTLYKAHPAKTQLFTWSPTDDGTVRKTLKAAPFGVGYWLLGAAPTASSTPSDAAGASPVEDTVAEADAKWLPRAACHAVLDPDVPEPLLQLPLTMGNVDTHALVDSGSALNFVSQAFVRQHGLDTWAAPKLSVRVANGQRLASTRVLETTVAVGTHRFTNVQFRVLPDLAASSVILGIPGLKALDVQLNVPDGVAVVRGDAVPCTSEPRRVACEVISPNKLAKLCRKAARVTSTGRAATNVGTFFLCTLQPAAPSVDDITTDFGPDFDERVKAVVREFPTVTADFEGLPPSRGALDHRVELTGEPRRQRRNRLSVAEHEELRRQCTDLFKQGRVRVSNSPFAAPIVLVRKPDGSMRMCVDYRGMNSVTRRDASPIERIDDLLDKLRDAHVMTHLDLASGYSQLRMHEDSVATTAFQGVTPSGHPCLLESLVMPFGMCNAPASFTRLMHHVLAGLDGFVLVYLDDVCIFSPSLDAHLDHLRQVLARLRDHSLCVRLKKCHWGRSETEYLGFVVGRGLLRPSPEKIAAVRDWPLPRNQREVKSFTAFVSFYRKFIHHFADLSAPLTDMCRKGMPKDVVWTDEAVAAFEGLKARMIGAPVLQLPDVGPHATFVVATDASDVGLGGVLLQVGPTGSLQPCAYWARKLKPAERNWSAYDREALAATEAVQQWRCYLEGCKAFDLVVDHSTLQYLMRQSSENLTPRQQRLVERLQTYAGYMSIRYRKGPENEADPLSRRPDLHAVWWDGDVDERRGPDASLRVGGAREAADPSVADLGALQTAATVVRSDVRERLLAAYAADEYYSAAGKWRQDGLQHDADLLFRNHGRIVVPGSLRQGLMEEFHNAPMSGHFGPRRTFARMAPLFWWPRMRRTIYDYCRRCTVCARAKGSHRGPAPLHPLPVPNHPWEHVGLDFVTGLPRSGEQGHTAVLVVVCHLTKMAHFIPCTDEVTAEQSASLFLQQVVRLHGVPRVLVSDRDPRFISDFWRSLWAQLGTKLNMSTARHPQTDGLSERTNATMQQLLRCYASETGVDWSDRLPMVEFSYNSAINESTNHSPFEAVYGRNPATPADQLTEDTDLPVAAAERLQALRETQATVRALLQQAKDQMAKRSTSRRLVTLAEGDYAYLSSQGITLPSQPSSKLRDRQLGPFKVVARVGDRSYRLSLPPSMRIHDVFHVDKLTPAAGPEPLRPEPPAATDDTAYVIERISEARIKRANRVSRLEFLVHYATYEVPEWNTHDNVDECSALDEFLATPAWRNFKAGRQYQAFIKANPSKAVQENR